MAANNVKTNLFLMFQNFPNEDSKIHKQLSDFQFIADYNAL